MNTKNFIELLKNENAVRDMDLKQLDSVLENFPYFQSARMLYLRNLKIHNNFLFNSYLRTTASYVGDRTVLFEYITQDSNDLDVDDSALIVDEVSSEKSVETETTSEVVEVEKQESKQESKQEAKEESKETHDIINFSADDRFSFNEWLQLSNVKEIHRRIDEKIEASEKEDTKLESENPKFDLIDKFISSNPKLKPKPKGDVPSGNIALSGTKENEGWMTETLAQVYIEQKKYSKAIKAYKILGLKYPEKSGFFADRIRAIKKLSDY